MTTETIRIGDKNETKRGTRYLSRETLQQQIMNGMLEVVGGNPAEDVSITVRSRRYVESDTAFIRECVVSAQFLGKSHLTAAARDCSAVPSNTVKLFCPASAS